MYRGEGWTMYRIGQLIEEISVELVQYRSLLTFQFEESVQFQVLESLLISNQSLSNYRSVYRTYFEVTPAIDLLFLNKQNPKSILAQLESLVELLEQLPKKENGDYENDVSNLAFACYSKVRLISVEKLLAVEKETGFRKNLDAFCEELNEQILTLSSKLSAHYFSHTTYQYQGTKDSFQFEV
jgi:uncharacterized alpha-E superfamily protein